MDIITQMKNFSLTINGETLETNERDVFFRFLACLKGATVLFRGLSDKYLLRVYNTDTNSLEALSDSLFIVGDKGKHFFEKNFLE